MIAHTGTEESGENDEDSFGYTIAASFPVVALAPREIHTDWLVVKVITAGR